MMTTKEKTEHYFLNWIGSLIDIIDGLAGVITLGIWRPVWDMRFVAWRIVRGLKKAKAKRLKTKKLSKSETSIF